MSKGKKLRVRLDSLPKDFTWDELVRLMGQYGFKVLNGSGSRRKFINIDNRIVSLHSPHPGSIMKEYALKEVKALLDELDNDE
ncbi:type II toxin-antitoxin system HicA family toxin [Serratia fonticola]|uniref:type II toxin-antitoxin system HicA family toxin n=1 Tax=Serratia fonticola TaxID=47917 RepID=UPI00157597E3|nr:type II toxin-antitoxin system HicA family toxin [Serratia fonticola]NTY85546.1 type II toxin-antitoxin system HicA family toxin [Serratia fonticola]NTZ11611.1 type II toxin-antitoxin system HicA family toxin [Serratia fonticola]